jgi:SAM-dependent methyltransferase
MTSRGPGEAARAGGGDALRAQVRAYYDDKLRSHGATPRGADWNSLESQELRFRELARLWGSDRAASIVDYGCGYGALAVWLRRGGHTGPYIGYDLSTDMTNAAATAAAGLPDVGFTVARHSLTAGDYCVASGVMNVKLSASETSWREYVVATIADLASLGRRGFAFNALTAYSDVERQRPDLHYADPLELFDHCRRTYSRHVALLHDYPLYEFTLLVRL